MVYLLNRIRIARYNKIHYETEEFDKRIYYCKNRGLIYAIALIGHYHVSNPKISAYKNGIIYLQKRINGAEGYQYVSKAEIKAAMRPCNKRKHTLKIPVDIERIIENTVEIIHSIPTLHQQCKERIKDMHIMLRFLPFLHQKLLSRNLDTVKILEIVKQKMDSDFSNQDVSELEKYMSVFLYADIQPNKAKEEIRKFLHLANRAYIHDVCYMNLMEFYYRSTSDEFDGFLINMIADLYFRARPNIDKGLKKGIFIQDLKDRKNKSKNL